MSTSSCLRGCGRAAVVLAAVLLLAHCDLPTEPPRFELTTGLNTPLLVDKTFVLLGPSETGFEALIDTTSSRFDSLFTVEPSNQTVAITQDLEGFETELPDDLLPTLDVDPIDVSFSASEISGDTSDQGSGGEIQFTPNGESFSSGSAIALNIADVHFAGANDYVEIGSGVLRIENLRNEFDVAFDELLISVPSLRRAPFGPGDSLVVRFEGTIDQPAEHRFRRVDRKSGPRSEEIDLTGYRLYASGEEISYYVFGRNESANDVRTLRSSEALQLSVRIEDVAVSALSAELDPLGVSVTDDVNQDGQLDVLDDDEAEVVDFERVNVLDDFELGDFQLLGSELRIHVRSNIAADFALYTAIAGTDEEGETVYLEGRGAAAVDATDPVAAAFSAGGAPLDPRNLIRVELEGSPSPDEQVVRTIVLNGDNSNVDAFVSRIPSEVRMVARLVIQPDGGRVHLREPFQMETSIGVTIPLAFVSGISLDRTFDADLSDLEDVASDSNDAVIDEAALELSYGNGLPLGLDLQVDVLDAADGVVASFPKADQSMHVDPASTDEIGIATQPSEGTFTIGISRSDLEAMSRGRRIRLRFALTTSDSGQARLRASDTFTMRLRGRFRVQISAD